MDNMNQDIDQVRKATLDKVFTNVRQNYFPRWDQRNRWTCGVLDGTGVLPDEPIGVWPFVIDKGRDHLEAALIIEICLAMTRGRGRPAFSKRLRTARSVAANLRRLKLARLLGNAQFGRCRCCVGQQHGLIPI